MCPKNLLSQNRLKAIYSFLKFSRIKVCCYHSARKPAQSHRKSLNEKRSKQSLEHLQKQNLASQGDDKEIFTLIIEVPDSFKTRLAHAERDYNFLGLLTIMCKEASDKLKVRKIDALVKRKFFSSPLTPTDTPPTSSLNSSALKVNIIISIPKRCQQH